MQPVDLSLLVPLDALLQEGSVTGAARRLGLSVPAVSHALRRIRDQLGDPVLVRSGRGMIPTPRADALREPVHSAVLEASRLLTPLVEFTAVDLDRTFVVHASDYVLTILGTALDDLLATTAPRASLRFVPNAPDDAPRLRDGGSDLAVGIYGDLPQEMRSRQLLTDRFVCVVRQENPRVGRRLSLQTFLELDHIQVAPRGMPGGYLDDVLAARGHQRHVARAVPYFLPALQLAAQTDYLLTVSERVALKVAPSLGLRVLEAPLPLEPYALSLVWHPRYDGDPAHRFLRDTFASAAAQTAGDRHPKPRQRLDVSDPTSGQGRRRKVQKLQRKKARV